MAALRGFFRSHTLLLALAACAAAGGVWLWVQLARPVELPESGVVVRIEPGWTMHQVADRLERGGVVRQAQLLALLARWRGVDREIRAGEYRFAGAVTMANVLARLRSPAAALRLLTVPEGLTAAELARTFERAGFGGSDVFECQMRSTLWLREVGLPRTGVEGYLFPDTYAFSRGTPAEEILRRMISRFRRHAASLSEERVHLGLSEHEMVTLASLIEKETGIAAERPLVAAVFHNRLHRGMLLQSDPTAVYERPDFEGPITRADLDFPSPYNTYQHAGLPPGPICNPGLASLRAAVRPANVDYLYFVARDDGTHEFSTTLKEHNRAVRRYRHRHGT